MTEKQQHDRPTLIFCSFPQFIGAYDKQNQGEVISSLSNHRSYELQELYSYDQSNKMGNKVSLEDEMVNLRIVSKQMQRSSKKCEKNEKAALQKLKKVSHSIFVVGAFICYV